MVSVIIPVYNSERFVSETLRSVLSSDYADLEVICVNDGSTDGSLTILNEISTTDRRVKIISQTNGGVCQARNTGILASHGEYILPLDSDDMLEPTFISRAVHALEKSSDEIKAIIPQAEFFGSRTGSWRLKPFTIHLLARKNIIPATALYRRRDYNLTNGYCTEIIAREDWEFWIQMLKDGGKIQLLPGLGLRYRVHPDGKRVRDRRLKRHVIDTLNRRHPEFFERELGGPLRYWRTWSQFTNRLVRLFNPRRIHIEKGYESLRFFCASLPYRFRDTEGGTTIYKGRNELRLFVQDGHKLIVKSFCRPHLINRIAYGLLRKSKAQRSCEYATLLRQHGIDSPAPVGYVTLRHGLLFSESYYISLKSELPYTYIDLIKGRVPEAEIFFREVGRLAGRMHEAGMIHRDFSRGNLLMGMVVGRPRMEIIDLNRIRFHQITMEEGLAGFSRLPANDEMIRLIAEGYAEVRGYDKEECIRRWPEREPM